MPFPKDTALQLSRVSALAFLGRGKKLSCLLLCDMFDIGLFT